MLISSAFCQLLKCELNIYLLSYLLWSQEQPSNLFEAQSFHSETSLTWLMKEEVCENGKILTWLIKAFPWTLFQSQPLVSLGLLSQLHCLCRKKHTNGENKKGEEKKKASERSRVKCVLQYPQDGRVLSWQGTTAGYPSHCRAHSASVIVFTMVSLTLYFKPVCTLRQWAKQCQTAEKQEASIFLVSHSNFCTKTFKVRYSHEAL